MTLPEPRPGLVIRYDYLWTREAAAALEHGKERPACIIAASDASASPRFVVILPITHTPPEENSTGIAIPPRVGQTLGLDHAQSWIIVSEYNVDEWPNGGLSPVPGGTDKFSYGFIPPKLFAQVKTKFLELNRLGKSTGVKRD